MKRTRKGFTLVELLIVVAILATLTAAMTASISGSTGKAKAAVIASNIESMKEAAGLFYVRYMDDYDSLNVSTTAMLDDMIPTWGDYQSGTIKYTPEDNDKKGRYNWAVTVDFSKDGDKDEIIAALKKIKGYGSYTAASAATGGGSTGGSYSGMEGETPSSETPGSGESGSSETTDTSRVKDGAFKVTLWNGKIEAATPASN